MTQTTDNEALATTDPHAYTPPVIISKQSGAVIELSCNNKVFKSGYRVKRSEFLAMCLVTEYTDVPVPNLIDREFDDKCGTIVMDLVPGVTLVDICMTLDGEAKLNICRQVWEMVLKWRCIPKPRSLADKFLCLTDGTPSEDVYIRDLQEPPRPLPDDEAVRQRIAERYIHYHGWKYSADELVSALPHSEHSVFTHADLAPRNIMVDPKTLIVTGIIDWECAGWYPDYWECANIWKVDVNRFDWAEWMEKVKPLPWKYETMQSFFVAGQVLFW